MSDHMKKQSQGMSSDNLMGCGRFVSIKEAATIVSYTPDYIARLAREGKVVAEQRGRVWLVSLDSLKLFSLKQEAERRARFRALREERLREYAACCMTQRTLRAVNADKQFVLPSIMVAGVLGICLLLVSVISWTSYNEGLQPSDLSGGVEFVWKQLTAIAPHFSKQHVAAVVAAPVVPDQRAYVPQHVQITKNGTLLVRDEATVDEIISDPVIVTAVTDNSFHVQPLFGDADAVYVVELVPRGRAVSSSTATTTSI